VRELGKVEGLRRLQSTTQSLSGKPLVMRLQNGDVVKMQVEDKWQLMRVVKMNSQGQISFAKLDESNTSARELDKLDTFTYYRKNAGPLQGIQARRVTISPIGELRDPGFKE
jgi:CRISPR-associated endonuclease Csn1